MKNKIIITRKNNANIAILEILSIFRDKNIIKSLEEISNYMKAYEKDDEIKILCDKEKIDIISRELNDEKIIFRIA